MILDYMSNSAHPACFTVSAEQGTDREGQTREQFQLLEGYVDGNGLCGCPYCGRMFRLAEMEGPVADDRPRHICSRCGYEWTGRSGEPSKCPKCGSHAWNKPAIECRCNVCNYVWVSRKPEGPSRCPNCKSNRWDEDPRTAVKVVRGMDAAEANRRWILERYESGQGCVEIASALGLPVLRVMTVVKGARNSPVMPKL